MKEIIDFLDYKKFLPLTFHKPFSFVYNRKNNRKVRRVINTENRRVSSRKVCAMFEFKNAEVEKIMELSLNKLHCIF